jgi:hypothetical protein
LPEVITWMPACDRPTGRLWAKPVSGEMSAGERHVLLRQLGRLDDEQRGLLTNARCLSEGVDVPTLDGVAFIDPRRSEVDIVQAVGRAIRKSDGKAVGTIVIPVFIATDVDPDVALDDSSFKPVWDVIQALRAHDEDLSEELDNLRQRLGEHGGLPRLPEKIHFDLPTMVGTDFADAFDVRLVEQTTAPWEFWYGLLKKYVRENGTSRVPQLHVFDGRRLGQWVTIQRSNWEALSDERRERLQLLPGWSTDVRADQWAEGFGHLQKYVTMQGHARVRDDYVADGGYKLGKWVGKQRTKWDSLDDEQRQRLLALPGWVLDARAALWEDSFCALTKFALEKGHTNPPRSLVLDGIALETWVRRQRRNWDSLSDDQRLRLEQLPAWTLNVLDAKWDIGFGHLQKYVEEHANAQVPQSYAIEGYALGKWVSVQRRTWDTLTEDRRERLRKLPGWTLDARGSWWSEGFGYLERFVAQNGTAQMSQDQVFDGFKLGSWVSNQKARWHSLGDERRQQLQSLPDWNLDARSAHWDQGFSLLEDYAAQHGHTRVPQTSVVDGYKLGVWLNTQRTNWSTLPDEKKQRLQNLAGWTINTLADQWDDGFAHLLRYVADNGDALVPNDCVYEGYKLGQWVTVQRTKWEAISDGRRQRLAALPGWAVSARQAWWEDGFRRLQKFVATNQHASPAQAFTDSEGFRLGAWVTKQRQSQAEGKLSVERRERLHELPGWQTDPRKAKWEEGFRRLSAFMSQNEGRTPPQSYVDEDDYRLGAWVAQQRVKRARGTLEADRHEQLAQLLGWE